MRPRGAPAGARRPLPSLAMSTSVIPENRLKRRLAAGGRAVGTMVAELRQPAVMQLLANAGFDFAIVDMEHGALGVETASDLCRAGVAYGVTPIVRVTALEYVPIAAALDGGAQGVMIPRVRTPEEAAEVVRIATYLPRGGRGSALGRAHTGRGGDVRAVMDAADAERLVVIQIETREALARVDEIAAVPGVDVLFVGPNDLAIELGVPGPPSQPELVEAIERVAAAARAAGIWSAVQMNTVELAARFAPAVDLLSYSADASLLALAGAQGVAAVREATGA